MIRIVILSPHVNLLYLTTFNKFHTVRTQIHGLPGLCLSTVQRQSLSKTHECGVKAICSKVGSESLILKINGVLSNLRDAKPGNGAG